MRVATNTVSSLLDLYRSELSPLFGVSEARAMAHTVFHEAFGWDRTELEAQRTTALSESELLKVYTPLTRLRTGEPLQYVLGRSWFMGMALSVAPGVLIPRPETEELVDLIHRSGRSYTRIIDIGTGSGCIALALKRLFPQAEVTGVDVSDEALAIARRNSEAHALDVRWSRLDVLDPAAVLPQGLDLVVSNPPYVPRSEEASLELHVRDHEPHLALFVDDADPLLFYRAIGRKAWDALVPGGALWFEGHYLHAEAVGEMLTGLGYSDVSVLQDLSGSPRSIRAVR
ncbi:MAG: peptide chain release factor N(5)-glutamine methyltransferase [Flavobacteriales bacterium]|nr:peptide chain release factor N(5)-glutamine methyltransferase [Flavobacteriales bacterium]